MNYLYIPKCRGGQALDERLKIKVEAGVTVGASLDLLNPPCRLHRYSLSLILQTNLMPD